MFDYLIKAFPQLKTGLGMNTMENKFSPLQTAILFGLPQLNKLFEFNYISKNVNHKDSLGNTALHYACLHLLR